MVGHWAPLDGSLARTILGPAEDTGRGPMEAHEAPRPTPPLFLLRAALFFNGCNVGPLWWNLLHPDSSRRLGTNACTFLDLFQNFLALCIKW